MSLMQKIPKSAKIGLAAIIASALSMYSSIGCKNNNPAAPAPTTGKILIENSCPSTSSGSVYSILDSPNIVNPTGYAPVTMSSASPCTLTFANVSPGVHVLDLNAGEGSCSHADGGLYSLSVEAGKTYTWYISCNTSDPYDCPWVRGPVTCYYCNN